MFAEREIAQVRSASGVVEDALRPHPTVDDARLGRDSERAADAVGERCHVGRGQRAAVQAVAERPTWHPAHDHVGRTRLAPVIMDGDDGGMAERRHLVDGRLERQDELRLISDLLADDPDGEVPIEAGQLGGVHSSIATSSEPVTESVAA